VIVVKHGNRVRRLAAQPRTFSPKFFISAKLCAKHEEKIVALKGKHCYYKYDNEAAIQQSQCAK